MLLEHVPKHPLQKKLFLLFEELDIESETIEHQPVMTVEDTKALSLPMPVCKNLFLKDRRKRLYLLIALPTTKIHLKSLAKKINAPELRFAEPALLKVLDVEPGAVSLFGIMNDTENKVTVLLDAAILKKGNVGFHPFVHEATTFIKSTDIYPFLEACGAKTKEIDFEEL